MFKKKHAKLNPLLLLIALIISNSKGLERYASNTTGHIFFSQKRG